MLNRAILCVFLLVASGVKIGLACNLCSPAAGRTMLTDLDAADVAMIAVLKEPTPPRKNPTAFDFLNRDRQNGEAGFIVRTVLRGEPAANIGEFVTVPLRIPGPSDALHLITYIRSEDRWSSYRLTDDSAKFAAGAASLPVPTSKNASLRSSVARIEFCMRFLGTDDFLLRRAVFTEFSKTPYSAIRRLRPKLQRELIHDWMQLASRRSDEARQIFLLLSVGGDETDVPMLEKEFRHCVDSNWAGTLDGVILAYISLGGVEALDHIDESLLSSHEQSVELKKAAAKALRFLVDHETTVSRPRLLMSCRLLLRDPRTTDLVAGDLARWESWSRGTATVHDKAR